MFFLVNNKIKWNKNKIYNKIIIRNNIKKRVLKYIFYKDIISLKKYKLLNIIILIKDYKKKLIKYFY